MNIAQIAPAIPLEFLVEVGALSKFHGISPSVLNKLQLVGGGGVYPPELSKAIVEQGHYVELITPMPHAGIYDVDDRFRIRFVRAKYFKPFSPSNPLTLFNPGLFSGFDIIHIHQFKKTTSNMAAIYGKLLGEKVFVTDHGGGGLAFNYSRFIDSFLAVSKYSAKQLERFGREVRVILGGVDLNGFSANTEAYDLRSKVLNGEEGTIILYVGQIRPHKRIEDLIEAFSRLRSKHRCLKLVICGGALDSKYYQYLTQIVKSGLREDVIFTGYVTEHEKLLYYLASDVFVSPSSHELLGLTLLEAMAAGKPVVASKVGGVPEVVIDGKTGFLVKAKEWRKSLKPGVISITELAAKINILIEEEDLRRRMGEEGRRRVEKDFTLDKVAERVLNAYKEFT